MRLANPGAGEIIDRLTILALKILHGGEQGKDIGQFVRERAQLLPQIRSRELNGSWFEAALDLAVVNAAIWDAEDEVRRWRSKVEVEQLDSLQWRDAARACMRPQMLNDRRAALIDQINKEAGDQAGGEKIHG